MRGIVMNYKPKTGITFIVILTLLLICNTFGNERKVNWEAFGANLVVALKSNHPGLQESAMQRIIQYSENLDVTEAVYDIALIFRFDGNSQMRRLAMVTLSKINTDHSLSYLCQYLKYEENSSIRKQCCCIIKDYYVAKKPDKMDELVVVLAESVHD